MSVLVFQWRQWWTRFSRRATVTATAAPAVPGSVPEAGPEAGTAPASVKPPAPAVLRPEPDAAPLLEIVQQASLGPRAAVPHPVDPAARERTLAGLRGLQQIPALQSLARGFLLTLNQPHVAVAEVVEAIRKDSALCVRLLRAANSAAVASEQRIEDLEMAVQMLGILRVRKMMQAMFTLRDGNRVAAGFDWRHLWIHALATAAIAEELERRLCPVADSQIHLAALLHDVGKIVLSTLAPEEYREVLLRAWYDGGPLEELERERLGVDHREAGAVFARHNGLPGIVVAAIEHHHAPAEAPAHRVPVALIGLANHLSKAHGLGFSGARLGENDGEFEDQTAWAIVEQACGARLEPAAIEEAMGDFLAQLRADLRGLRETA
jgi:putative nucleotidyltransferase with HDIG domain